MPIPVPFGRPLDILSPPQRIGLLSDSHGEFQIVGLAVDLLRREGADCIIHLGDFFDSAKNISRERIVNFFRENNILAVKGNNEAQIESTLQSGKGANPEVINYLSDLCGERIIGDLCFVHVMPSKYLYSLYEPIDGGNTDRALSILLDTSHRIIFSGHSHTPVMFELIREKIKRQIMHPGSHYRLRSDAKYIIIPGSSESGICGLFDRVQMLYCCIRVDSHERVK